MAAIGFATKPAATSSTRTIAASPPTTIQLPVQPPTTQRLAPQELSVYNTTTSSLALLLS